MSITFTKAYVANGKTFATLEEAQQSAILAAVGDYIGPGCNGSDIAAAITQHKDAIVDILTMTERSRPKARGAKKPRKNRVTEPVQTTSA